MTMVLLHGDEELDFSEVYYENKKTRQCIRIPVTELSKDELGALDGYLRKAHDLMNQYRKWVHSLPDRPNLSD